MEAHQTLNVSKTQILNKDTQSPTVGDGMMNCEDQHVMIGAPAQHIDSVERSLDQIKWLTAYLIGQFFDTLFAGLRSGKLPKAKVRQTGLANHLYRPLFARKEGEA